MSEIITLILVNYYAGIFDIEQCWMKSDANNKWLFASMGVAIQIAQWDAIKNGAFSWKIKEVTLN